MSEITVNLILHNILILRKGFECWVLHQLIHEQKQMRVNCCRQVSVKKKKKALTEDEISINPNSKFQHAMVDLRLPSICQSENTETAEKVMLNGLWDAKVVLSKNYLPCSNTVKGQCYANLLTKIRKIVTKNEG